MVKRFLAFLFCIILCISICGCNQNDEITSLRYRIASLPVTVDPQIASTNEELSVVYNIFEGLTRINSSGEAVLAAAESYTVSDDGLVYTFKIAEGKQWSDETPLTAYDFEYGIRRAVDPDTKSPNTDKLTAIFGAEQILNGKADVSTLGVKVLDSSTLEITLKSVCQQFLTYVASPVFMPCNEKFFTETKGKYGLDRKNTLYNGVYYISRWDEENDYLTITASDDYVGKFSSKYDSVVYSCGNNDELSKEFNNGDIHLFASHGSTSQSRFENSEVLTVSNTTATLCFGSYFNNDIMLTALRESINTQMIANDTATEYATGFIPGNIVINGKNYRENAEDYPFTYNSRNAYETFIKALGTKKYNGVFPETSIYYVNEGKMEAIAKQVAAYWQKDLGAYVNIQSLTRAELTRKLRSGDYYFALVPFTADSSAEDFLADIGSSGVKISNNTAAESSYENLLNKLKENNSPNTHFQNVAAVEEKLFQSKNLLPICFTGTEYICRNELKDELRYTNGVFDFWNYQ